MESTGRIFMVDHLPLMFTLDEAKVAESRYAQQDFSSYLRMRFKDDGRVKWSSENEQSREWRTSFRRESSLFRHIDTELRVDFEIGVTGKGDWVYPKLILYSTKHRGNMLIARVPSWGRGNNWPWLLDMTINQLDLMMGATNKDAIDRYKSMVQTLTGHYSLEPTPGYLIML